MSKQWKTSQQALPYIKPLPADVNVKFYQNKMPVL
jgi:hypothetical protein